MLNPANMLAETRDSTRLTDLNAINQALGLYQYYSASSFGAANTIYISIPRAAADDCGYGTGNPLGLPAIPAGYSYVCKDTATYRKIDGTGWIPVDFTQISGGSPLATLPVDPVNNAQQGLYYSYIGGSWTLNSMLESQKYLSAKAKTDGGTDDARYEVGPKPSLWAAASGLVGYWKMDESGWTNDCTTNTVMDSSQNATPNHGKSCPAGTGPTGGAAGKVGNAGSFDGVNDYIDISNAASLNPTNITIGMWLYLNSNPDCDVNNNWRSLIHKGSTAGTSTGYDIVFEQGRGIAWDIGNGAAQRWWPSGVLIPIQIWSHLTVSYNAATGEMRAYQDGSYKSNRIIAPSSIAANTGNLLINNSSIACPNGSGNFPGIIDEVRIYNRALSDVEIKSMYNATK